MTANKPRRASAPVTSVDASVQLTGPAAFPPPDAGPPVGSQPPVGQHSPVNMPVAVPGGQNQPGRRVLPTAPESESNAAWGEDPDSNDADLAENRPPHW